KFGPDSTLVVHLDGLPADASQFSLTAMAAGDQEERYRAPGEAPKISKTDARNEYTLQPGKIVVQLRAKGPVGDSFGVLLARHVIELGDEPQEFRIQVPALSDMRLVAPEDYPRGWLRLFGDPFVHSAPQLTPDKERRIVFKNLPPGEYILRGPLGQMTVRMPQAEETVIGGTPFNGWMVGRCDDSNVMGTFDLRQGDIIREVNGKPAAEKGTSPYWPAFARLTGDGDITLKVQRNGSWVTLTTTAG